ncbi:MAG: sulfotransferase [Halioglobus sp.]|nr:sulfotransferase [Halioglobus sp.]
MNLLCFFGHHRCASSWTHGMLRSLAVGAGWRYRAVLDSRKLQGGLANDLAEQAPEVLALVNARREDLAVLPPFRGVHIVRDPRDVLVSAYFSHRNSHPTQDWPELVPHRQALRAANEADGLLLELDWRAQQFAEMAAWDYHDERILEWRMEELVRDPLPYLQELFRFWHRLAPQPEHWAAGVRRFYNRATGSVARRLHGKVTLPAWRARDISPTALEQAVTRHSFQRKSGGRSPGQVQPDHHYRSGVAGDWRKHFTRELRTEFKRRHGDLLMQLGYEKDDQW